MGKVSLYFHTVKHLKFSQITNRLCIRMGGSCSIGVRVSPFSDNVQILESPLALDFDSAFVARFPVSQLLENNLKLLHSCEFFDWKSRWYFDDKSDLWNYNLHYFEYLFPLIKTWKDSGDEKYKDKTIEMIKGWIDNNPEGTSPAWASYPTAIRIVNWISWYGYVEKQLNEAFRQQFLSSLHAQYKYLTCHLEKDILGNHYFEDLKSILLASLFFRDDMMTKKSLDMFRKECKEEILPDGMHFELSPMYHKIILEGVMRVSVALRSVGKKDETIEGYIQPMLDVAYTFENEIGRVPLFNDGGNNIAKSLEAIVNVAKDLGYYPNEKNQLESSGFYFFRKTYAGKTWRLIVDAGQPGPNYIPGHSHCDAMSFELFCDGEPIVVNCGTYAYQCKERNFFRSTAAHNTVMIDGTEQSQCWGLFRLAKRSKVKVLEKSDSSILMKMIDQKGNVVVRSIGFDKSNIRISDRSEGHKISSFLHLLQPINYEGTGNKTICEQPYATDYGYQEPITSVEFQGCDSVDIIIFLLGGVNE